MREKVEEKNKNVKRKFSSFFLIYIGCLPNSNHRHFM